MIEGIVTSLEIHLKNGMGNRGSKSDSFISVKEQRADGSLILNKYYKVCSNGQGNLVRIFQTRNINTIISNKIHTFNQGARFSFYSTKTISSDIYLLNPNYVTGFADGEGCFYIGISPNSKYKTGYRVKAIFQLGVHENDIALLMQIKDFFGVGSITKLGEASIQFRVTKLEDLNIIIRHFDFYPLLTYKQFDFNLFKKVVSLMEQGEHLTKEGLNKLITIKDLLNKNYLSKELNVYTNTQIKCKDIKDLNWLSGFTDAEGCFFIALKKSSGSKLGETVWLKFILTQHVRDKDLLENFINIFNCGRYIPKSEYGEFVVEKFSDIYDKVIPLFDNFKLHGIKSKNFEDFKLAAALIKSKAHLTREGLDEIKKIKGRMNKNRK